MPGCAQVGLKLDFPGAEAFIRERMNKRIDMDGIEGGITTFIVEPFVPHSQEYYLSIQVGAKEQLDEGWKGVLGHGKLARKSSAMGTFQF